MATSNNKIVLLLGAGATVSDVATRSLKSRPPLDNRFFGIARATHPTLVARVNRYMKATYDADITARSTDSLEAVMGQIYTDIFNRALKDSATVALRALLQLFTRRLAETTNGIEATNKRWVYRIITHYLAEKVDPGNIAIVTFNQDLQVEKCLSLMRKSARWKRVADQLFNFPTCYGIGEHKMTAPTGTPETDLFTEDSPVTECIRVLKLHGSLNWYSIHNSATPSPTAMFNPRRALSLTRRQVITPNMPLSRATRSAYTLPVIVPPVSHKSAVLHDALKDVWWDSEAALREADDVVIFGYSCPDLDFESSNLLLRAQKGNDAAISVIDPDGGIARRYIDLLNPRRLYYYPSARDFLADR